jgi:hypothetical protein
MEGTEIVPSEQNDGPTKRKYQGVCVKVYFNEPDFAEVAKLAEKAGKRRVGLSLYTLKPHGFADEKLANTDGIARFLKMAANYWKAHQAELEQKAKANKEEAERLRGYGVKV